MQRPLSRQAVKTAVQKTGKDEQSVSEKKSSIDLFIFSIWDSERLHRDVKQYDMT